MLLTMGLAFYKKTKKERKIYLKKKKLLDNIYLAWINRCQSILNKTANIRQLGQCLCLTFVNLIRIQFPVSWTCLLVYKLNILFLMVHQKRNFFT